MATGAADACDSGSPNSSAAAGAEATAKLRLSAGDSVEIDSGASVSPDSNQFSTRSSSTSSTVVERKLKQPAAAAASSSPRGAKLAGKLPAAGDADSLGEEEDDEEEARVAVRLEADTISDESGYSEENNGNAKGGVGGVGGRANARTKELHSGLKTVVLLNASSASSGGEGDEGCDRRSNRVPIPAPRAMTPKTPRAAASASSPGTSPASPIHCDLTVHSALISDFLDKTTKGDAAAAAGGGGGDQIAGRITEFCINI